MDDNVRQEGGLQEAIFTERVRIVGADQAGSTGSGDSQGEPSTSGGHLFDTSDEDVVAELLATPELPHWTDPPTGQVPAVLRKTDDSPDTDTGPASGPVWREHSHEWEDTPFEPSLLADEGTRQGQLEEAPLEERQPWEFDLEVEETSVDLDATGPLPTVDVDLRDDLGGLGGPDDPRFTPNGEVDDLWQPPSTDEAGSVRGFSGENAGDTGQREPHWSTMDGPDDSEVGLPGTGDEGATPTSQEPRRGVRSISSSPLRTRNPAATGAHRIKGRGPARSQSRPVGDPNGSRDQATSKHGAGSKVGRNVPLAVATGLGFAILATIIFQIGTVASLLLVTVVVTLALAECYAALRRSGFKPASLLGLVATIVLMITVYSKGLSAFPLVIALFVVATMVWYLIGADRGFPVEGITSTIMGFMWIGVLGSFGALMLAPAQFPHRHGIAFLFGAVVASVGADVGALVAGSLAGKHPLAKEISPNKTWEGVIGGAILAVALSALLTGAVSPWTPGKAAILGIIAAVLSPLGDLCESLIKRDLGVKDMSQVLPGHGGLLDRFDGLFFVLPATYYLVRVLHLG